MTGWDRKFDLQLLSQCGSMFSRSVPEIHLHAAGMLSNQGTNKQCELTEDFLGSTGQRIQVLKPAHHWVMHITQLWAETVMLLQTRQGKTARIERFSHPPVTVSAILRVLVSLYGHLQCWSVYTDTCSAGQCIQTLAVLVSVYTLAVLVSVYRHLQCWSVYTHLQCWSVYTDTCSAGQCIQTLAVLVSVYRHLQCWSV